MITHGMNGSSEYQAWRNMKQRCFNPNSPLYPHYGGRKITVCDRWLKSFEDFFADMGLKPSLDYSIDRIDNNGNYSAKNCRWATREQQDNNKRNNYLITIKGETYTITQWAEKMGINRNVIYNRLNDGWSEYDAVLTPVHIVKLITIGTKTLTIVGWSKEMNFSKSVINTRLSRGWSEYDAVMTPVKSITKKQ